MKTYLTDCQLTKQGPDLRRAYIRQTGTLSVVFSKLVTSVAGNGEVLESRNEAEQRECPHLEENFLPSLQSLFSENGNSFLNFLHISIIIFVSTHAVRVEIQKFLIIFLKVLEELGIFFRKLGQFLQMGLPLVIL